MRIVQVDIMEHNLSKYISKCAISPQKVHGERLSKAEVQFHQYANFNIAIIMRNVIIIIYVISRNSFLSC